MKNLHEYTKGSKNHCYILRIIAALLVFYTHGREFYGYGEDELVYLTLKYTSHRQGFGSLGFGIFFVLSGFLITQSFERCNSLKKYAIRRIMRIYPLMLLCILFTMFVIGSIATTLSLNDYFTNIAMWQYSFNMLLPTIDNQLPGVFTSNPVHSVNGSLWTLGIEIILYCLVALLGIAGFLNQRLFWIIPCLFAALFLVNDILWQRPPIIVAHGFLPSFGVTKVMLLFMLGAALYVYRDKIPASSLLCVLCALITILGLFIEFSMIISLIAFSYVVIFVAFLPAKRYYGKQDLSYGIYITHLLVMQSMITVLPSKLTLWLYLALCLLFTCFIAFLSWRYIEKPSIEKAKKYF